VDTEHAHQLLARERERIESAIAALDDEATAEQGEPGEMGSEELYEKERDTGLNEDLAAQLAAIYHERWEIETSLDELKTHLRGAQIVLRSKTPELVQQEFYGLLMAHFAVRALMHEAALRTDEDPDRLSFLHAVRVVQRRMPRSVAIPPSAD